MNTVTDQPPATVTESRSKRQWWGYALALVPFAFLLVFESVGANNFDFEIYRNAMLDVMKGGSAYTYSIYQAQYGTGMGFVYPPFASLLLLPFAWMPDAVGRYLMAIGTATLVSAALVASFTVIDTRREASGRNPLSLVVWAWVSLPVAVAIPAVSNMGNGQVSFAIAAVVLLDVLVLPRRWRGILVGLMGGVKLTPMIMVPYYLVTKQWRAAINACSGFGVCVLVAALLRWTDSVRYWLHPDVINGSLGDLARWDNWSFNGDLARLGLQGLLLTVCWGAAVLVVLVAALWRARSHYLAGQGMEATLLMGLVAGLITSATWPHHLLFLSLACALLAVQRPLLGTISLLVLVVAGYLAHNVIGFLLVPIMIGFVMLGLPGQMKPVTSVGMLLKEPL